MHQINQRTQCSLLKEQFHILEKAHSLKVTDEKINIDIDKTNLICLCAVKTPLKWSSSIWPVRKQQNIQTFLTREPQSWQL